MRSRANPIPSVARSDLVVPGSSFYRHVEGGYDLLAPTYDEDVGVNPIGEHMRGVFRTHLTVAFSRGHKVLEIGCGTGIDAVWLARFGIDVVATDISQEMLKRTEAKADALGLGHLVHTRRVAASEIGELSEEFGPEAFDGAYCHAGALNMDPNLRNVPHQLAILLRRRALFICSVINKTSLFEILFYLAVLRPRKAFRRLNRVVPIPISRKDPLNRHVVPTRFYSPAEVEDIFAADFSVVGTQGLQVFLPPSNLADEYERLKPLFIPLERLEEWFSGHRPVNAWGHHSIITLERS